MLPELNILLVDDVMIAFGKEVNLLLKNLTGQIPTFMGIIKVFNMVAYLFLGNLFLIKNNFSLFFSRSQDEKSQYYHKKAHIKGCEYIAHPMYIEVDPA